jgi:predicted RNA-binding Zn-ribbon protein involved in translation (DUF1610 family)
MNDDKKCPKCGRTMVGDRRLASYTEITLKKEEEYIGDSVLPFYCPDCGYIELYREEENKRQEASR